MCLNAWFWNLDRTIRSDPINHESLFFVVILALRTFLCKKSMDLCEPWLNCTVLKTVNGSHGFFFSQQIPAEIKDSAGMHFGLFSDLEPKDLWGKKKLRRRRWQSRSYLKLKQQTNNSAQIDSHGLYLRLQLLFLLFPPLLFLLSISTTMFSHLPSVCFVFFFMFPKPLHVTCRKKIFIFELKMAKCFSRKIFPNLSPCSLYW